MGAKNVLKNNAPIRSARYDIYVLNFAIFEYRQVAVFLIFALPLFNTKANIRQGTPAL